VAGKGRRHFTRAINICELVRPFARRKAQAHSLTDVNGADLEIGAPRGPLPRENADTTALPKVIRSLMGRHRAAEDGAPGALVRCYTLTTGLRLSRIIE
jgi:hypothetical protein